MLMRTEHVPQSQLWFGFEYLIEFDDQALTHIATADLLRLRRRGDAYFSPRIETAWTDGLTEAPTRIRALLAASGTSSPADGGPLRGRVWQEVLPHFPDWAQQCAMATALAAELVNSRPAVTATAAEAAASAAAETARRARVMRARAALSTDHRERECISEDLDREAELAEQVEKGLRHPRSELLACTAIVLLPAHG